MVSDIWICVCSAFFHTITVGNAEELLVVWKVIPYFVRCKLFFGVLF
jgi:hypothetical protein